MRTLLDQGAITSAETSSAIRGDDGRAPCAAKPAAQDRAMGGPRSMELAGEIADGIHTACAYSEQALAFSVEDRSVPRGRT